ncbi:MAG: isoaspartyl peptidase/L-asparaginase [Bacteroidetes bacterium]|nr:isoaspartyl peptidase/L-asparaginase [Bacteroidota bacterium]
MAQFNFFIRMLNFRFPILLFILSFATCKPKQNILQTDTPNTQISMEATAVETTPKPRPPISIVVHGGAGSLQRGKISDSLDHAYRAHLKKAAEIGYAYLERGAPSEYAVEMAISYLEDCPLFNAGCGAVLTYEGGITLDASIMSGKTGKAGAVAGVKHIKNPIQVARQVMNSSPHVLLIGEGAERFATENGFTLVDTSYFFTEEQVSAWKKSHSGGSGGSKNTPNKLPSDSNNWPPINPDGKFGTVGAVALDYEGNLAAGTSTGGMMNKRWGRVGDSPIIGAGTYASNEVVAVSCTGHGEYFIRNAAAFDVAARMAYGKSPVDEAARTVIFDVLEPKGGLGGIIAIDAEGNISMPFSTESMCRAYKTKDKPVYVAIYKDE